MITPLVRRLFVALSEPPEHTIHLLFVIREKSTQPKIIERAMEKYDKQYLNYPKLCTEYYFVCTCADLAEYGRLRESLNF